MVENEELDPLGWISIGFVPDLDLSISWLLLLIRAKPFPLFRSCAALAEGLSNLLGRTEPFTSEFIGGMTSSRSNPFSRPIDSACDGASVEVVPALPLRFLSLYFSIASASLSNIRVAIGDSVFCVVGSPVCAERGGEGMEKLLADAEDGLWCWDIDPADGRLAEWAEGEDRGEFGV